MSGSAVGLPLDVNVTHRVSCHVMLLLLREEIVLDLAEMTRAELPAIEEELLDFGVVGPGPRRSLNFIFNRRWFDNEQDRSLAAEQMYVAELREFRDYLQANTGIAKLKELNLLGVQFALCEASKYFFYLRFESGSIYKPASRDFHLALQEVSEAEAKRLRTIWEYWQDDNADEPGEETDEQLHPDHLIAT